MKHHIMFIISLTLLSACGRTNQGANPDDPMSETADASAIPPVQDPIVNPQESNQEASPDPNARTAESIVPPNKVTGAYLVAKVIQTSETTVSIGLTAFVDSIRVATRPELYRALFSVTPSEDPGVTADLTESAVADHDMVLEMTGESIKAIKEQLPIIQIGLVVSNLVTNKKNDAVVRTVEAALLESASRDGNAAPVIEAMPKELDPAL